MPLFLSKSPKHPYDFSPTQRKEKDWKRECTRNKGRKCVETKKASPQR